MEETEVRVGEGTHPESPSWEAESGLEFSFALLHSLPPLAVPAPEGLLAGEAIA